MPGFDDYVPQPTALADGHWHILISYPSGQHRWAVRCYDMLRKLGFKVVVQQYVSPVAPDAVDFVWDVTVRGQMSQSLSRLLVWPTDDLTPTNLESLANLAKEATISCVVAINGATTPDSLPQAVAANGTDGPSWNEVRQILERLDVGTFNANTLPLLDKMDEQIHGALNDIKNADDKKALEALVESEDLAWLHSPQLGCGVAERLIGLKRIGPALSLLDKLEERFPDSVRLKQMRALAFRRSGRPEEAQAILQPIYQEGWRDPETLGILAASCKARFDSTKNLKHLQEAREHYRNAFEVAPSDEYVGINAAAMSALLGDKDESLRLADRVAVLFESQRLKDKLTREYWVAATLPEVYLLRENYARAGQLYERAVEIGKNEIGSHESTWIQAQRLMDALNTPPDDRAKIAAAFPHLGPMISLREEVKLAVVTYGGVSLAIYINGVVQELLNLVRATATVKQAGHSVLPFDSLNGTERVYRKLAQMLGADPTDLAVLDEDKHAPIRTRFVIDVLSGTSAGGINSVFLAKALANDQKLDQIKALWIKEADIEQLVNDKSSSQPKSLLDGGHMYCKLLEALEGMDRQDNTGKLNCASELDLFVTASDLNGLVVQLPLSDRLVNEKRHRNVFHFRHTPDSGANFEDFDQAKNPFLAFAARCTSAFPFAFEPMKLADIDNLMKGVAPYSGWMSAQLAPFKSDSKTWRAYYPDYLETDPVTGEYRADNEFAKRAFGDGGYLDNKPFTYAIRALVDRRSDLPVQRKLIYIEPAPKGEQPAQEIDREVDVIENVRDALVSLPRYETIREDLQEVHRRNKIINHVERITSKIETDIQVGQEKSRDESLTNVAGTSWSRRDLEDMIKSKGISYGGYHRLKVGILTDEIAAIIAAAANFRVQSAEAEATYELVRAWVRGNYADFATKEKQTENKLLTRFDLNYRIRRLRFVIAKIDELNRDRHRLQKVHEISGEEIVGIDENELKIALVGLKPQLSQILETLAILQRSLLARSTGQNEGGFDLENPLRTELKRQGFGHPNNIERLRKIADLNTEEERRAEAVELLSDFNDTVNAIAAELAQVVRDATIPASHDVDSLLKPEKFSPGLDTAEKAARKYLWHYYRNYEDYDLVTFPVLASSGVGEATSVDIHRVSPADVKNQDAAEKIAGTAFGAFGGFLKESWRSNDILRGRQHAAERILTIFLGADHPRYQELLNEALDVIVQEELQISGKKHAANLLLNAVQNSSDGVVSQDAGDEITRRLNEPPFGNIPLDREKFRDYVTDEYDVNRELDPKMIVRVLGRSTQVVGKMLTGLSENYKVDNQFAMWVTRLGRWSTSLVEVALPKTLSRLLFRHWLALFYMFELVIFAAGTVFGFETIRKFALIMFGITAGIDIVVRLFGDTIEHWHKGSLIERYKGVAKLLGAIVLLWFFVLGVFSAWYIWTDFWEHEGIMSNRLLLVGVAAANVIIALPTSWWLLGRWQWPGNAWLTLRVIATVGISVVIAAVILFAAALVYKFVHGSDWSHLLPSEWWQHPPF